MRKMYQYIFGPVLSRRLGMSLGIDLLPYKVCGYDCVYCECGATTRFLFDQEEFFPLEEVCAELRACLSHAPELDYITFSGSGEPLLYIRFPEVLRFLKGEFPGFKVALLTNSSLLPLPEVRESLRPLDLCVPSLDSATRAGFEAIDRPGPGFRWRVEEIVEGIKQTRDLLRGEMWLEIFIVPGINDTPRELEALRQAVDYIKPHKVQINSLDRPGTEDWVPSLSGKRKEEISAYLSAEFLEVKPPSFRQHNRKTYIPFHTLRSAVLRLLAGGACTREQLCRELDLQVGEIQEVIDSLLASGLIVENASGAGYSIAEGT